MQQRSSMQTSINTSRLPSVWGKLDYNYLRELYPERQLYVVDYGCGRRATQNKVYINLNCQVPKASYFPYDPYWGEADLNGVSLRCLNEYKEADLCVCANVLNVVDDIFEVEKIIREVTNATYWIFQIYEGDKSGNGKESKAGCWQRNTKTEWYAKLIRTILGAAPFIYQKGNLITNNPQLLNNRRDCHEH